MSLYIVATPIGNLEDISLRALRILKEVDFIAAEDTRHSKKLLDHYDIKTPLVSYHSHSSKGKVEHLIREMQSGKSIALISDAGTPGISDPAWSLTQAALEADIALIPVPGPAAFLTALMASGLPMDKFVYLGFLPIKKGRQTLILSFKDEERTVVFYESPHRLARTMTQLSELLGPNRYAIVARELTKMHEEFHRGSLADLAAHFKKVSPKGEMAILIAPKGFHE